MIILGLTLIHGQLPVEIKNILNTNLLEFCSWEASETHVILSEKVIFLPVNIL